MDGSKFDQIVLPLFFYFLLSALFCFTHHPPPPTPTHPPNPSTAYHQLIDTTAVHSTHNTALHTNPPPSTPLPASHDRPGPLVLLVLLLWPLWNSTSSQVARRSRPEVRDVFGIYTRRRSTSCGHTYRSGQIVKENEPPIKCQTNARLSICISHKKAAGLIVHDLIQKQDLRCSVYFQPTCVIGTAPPQRYTTGST